MNNNYQVNASELSEIEKLLNQEIEIKVDSEIESFVSSLLSGSGVMSHAPKGYLDSDGGDRLLLCELIMSTLKEYQLKRLGDGRNIIKSIKKEEFQKQVLSLSENLKIASEKS